MEGKVSRCKIVVVGDTQCGKTALLHVFAKDSYPETYVPTVFENYTASFEIDKRRIELNMWDTSGPIGRQEKIKFYSCFSSENILSTMRGPLILMVLKGCLAVTDHMKKDKATPTLFMGVRSFLERSDLLSYHKYTSRQTSGTMVRTCGTMVRTCGTMVRTCRAMVAASGAIALRVSTKALWVATKAPTHRALVVTHRALVETHRALVETHRALVETRRALVVTSRALVVTHRALVETRRALVVTHRALVETHRALVETRRALVVTSRALVVTHRALVATRGAIVASSSYYDNVRPLAYPDSDAVLICFDISRPETLDSVLKKWQGETQEYCPNAKVVLVGCKLDMRTDLNTLRELSKLRLIPVTHEQLCFWLVIVVMSTLPAFAASQESPLRHLFQLLLPIGYQHDVTCSSFRCRSGIVLTPPLPAFAAGQVSYHSYTSARSFCYQSGTVLTPPLTAFIVCHGPPLLASLITFVADWGTSLARQIGAVAYAECTSKYSENSVRDVFHVTTVASVGQLQRPPLKRSNSRRGLKRVSQQAQRSEILERPPTIRKDRAKSCVIM
ncbi:hypothetical protein NFI96_014365 [Prochilodus magdalenae]|nr:hypothetical protein NFI96_014365 [Prochilodus magdalenae]